jgi:hypothetical protein
MDSAMMPSAHDASAEPDAGTANAAPDAGTAQAESCAAAGTETAASECKEEGGGATAETCGGASKEEEGGGASKEDEEVYPDPLIPVRDPAFDESLARALGEVSGAMGIQSTTQAGHGLAKTAQVNKDLYEIPMPDQTLGCISVAGPTQFTKATSCRLRLVGFYPSEGERREHMEDLPAGNFLPVECGKPYTFGSRKFESVEEEKEYIRVMLERFERHAADRNRAFDAYVQERSSALTSKETEKELRDKEKEKFAEQDRKRTATSEALALARSSDAAQKAAAEASARASEAKAEAKAEAAKAQELKAVHAIHDQSWAVIALMHDLDQENDPIKSQWIFVLYGAFPTPDLANGHLSDTVQHAVPYMRCYVVKMYKWLELDQVNTKEIRSTIKGVYRFDNQQRLWDGARDSKPKARRFKEAQEKAEREQQMQAERRDSAPAPALAPALAAQTTADLLRNRLREENERDLSVRHK